MKYEDEITMKDRILSDFLVASNDKFKKITRRDTVVDRLGSSGYFEFSSGCLWHAKFIPEFEGQGENRRTLPSVRFFDRPPASGMLGNVWTAPVLPQPCAFLIESIRLFGVTSDLLHGRFVLKIFNKDFHEFPVWRLALREKDFRMEPLFIPPLTMFDASCQWQTLKHLERTQLLEVFIRGRIARPIQ